MLSAKAMLGAGVGALVLAIAAFFFGMSVGRDAEKAVQLVELKGELKDVRDRQAKQGALSQAQGAAEVARSESVREIYREVPKIIERDVYRNVCVDADGVRLLERAVTVANGDYRPAVAGGAGALLAAAGDGGSNDGGARPGGP